MSVDFQIIGGGLIGLSTAYALQLRGAKVRVIEARDSVALETSFANAGMLHAFNAAPWNRPGVQWQLLRSFFDPESAMKFRLSALPDTIGWGLKFIAASKPAPHWHATQNNYQLAIESIALTESWQSKLSMHIDRQNNGLLNIARSQKELDLARALTEDLKGMGFQQQVLSPVEAIQKEPALAPIEDKLVGAYYYPDDFSADAHKFCQALATEIERAGGEVLVKTKITDFVRENGDVIGVKTGVGDRLAETTILAAGARTSDWLKRVGIRIAMRPVKGYSLTFDMTSFPSSNRPVTPVIDDSLHAAITPLGERLRIAGTAEITGFNDSLPVRRLKPLLNMLEQVYPELAQGLTLDQGRPWRGFRPVSADGIPFIGTTRIKGLAVNTGQGHMGWTLAAGSGELLADILMGGTTKLDAGAFDPNRR